MRPRDIYEVRDGNGRYLGTVKAWSLEEAWRTAAYEYRKCGSLFRVKLIS